MALSETQSRCVGRSSMHPDAPVCPKREGCERYADVLRKDLGHRWPIHISVTMHLCSDPELSMFIPAEGEA